MARPGIRRTTCRFETSWARTSKGPTSRWSSISRRVTAPGRRPCPWAERSGWTPRRSVSPSVNGEVDVAIELLRAGLVEEPHLHLEIGRQRLVRREEILQIDRVEIDLAGELPDDRRPVALPARAVLDEESDRRLQTGAAGGGVDRRVVHLIVEGHRL